MKNFLVVFSIFISAFWGFAEESNLLEGKISHESLNYQVVVTATRHEQPSLEVGSSTTIITAEDLQKSGKKDLVDALKAIPGVDITQTGLGGNANAFIRGANSEHTLVMIDGVEVNDPISPGRTFNLAHLSLDNIERIEVVRGPQSPLYGSDAMGGVINIITKKGQGKPQFSLSTEAGSYNTFKESAGFSGGTEKINYSFGISRFDSKGYSASSEKYGNTERDSYGNTSLSARLGFLPLENLEITFISRFVDAKNDLDNSAGEGGDDPNYTMDIKQFVFSGNAKLSLLNNKWEQKLSVSYNRIKRNLNNGTDLQHPYDSAEGIYKGRMFKADWQHNINLNANNVITAGIEYEKEFGDSFNQWESLWGPGESLFPKQSAQTIGYYLQDGIKIKDTFFMNLGIRIDDHNRFGTKATYRLAPVLVLKSGTRLKASFGTGFKAPSLYQLFAPATAWGAIGNENLEPEESKGWDIGLEQSFFDNRLQVSATYFYNDFKNLIEYDWMLGYENIAKAETKGFEIFLKAFLGNYWNLQGSYTYTDAHDKTTDEKLVRRPKHKGNLMLNFVLLKKVNMNLNMIYIGKRDDRFPYPTRTIADDYTLFNLALSFPITKQIEFFARLDNIFNKEYEAILGYESPGRSAYIGFRANF